MSRGVEWRIHLVVLRRIVRLGTLTKKGTVLFACFKIFFKKDFWEVVGSNIEAETELKKLLFYFRLLNLRHKTKEYEIKGRFLPNPQSQSEKFRSHEAIVLTRLFLYQTL